MRCKRAGFLCPLFLCAEICRGAAPRRRRRRYNRFLSGGGGLAELTRTKLTVRQERAVLVGVILPRSTADPRDPLGELSSLARTAGAKVVGRVIQRRTRIHSGTYIGSGKAIEIAELA